MDEKEFFETVVLSRLTPGISILAQVMLVGRKVAGWRGVVAGLVGMLLPAITITVGLAQAYVVLSDSAAARQPLVAIAGVAAGFSAYLAIQLLKDTGRGARVVHLLGFVGGYVVLIILVGNPLVVLGVAILVGLVVPGLVGGSAE